MLTSIINLRGKKHSSNNKEIRVRNRARISSKELNKD
jgi:hypothetical protein